MTNEYFGIKEMSSMTLKAGSQMTFGDRVLEEGEPALIFDKVNIAQLSEGSSPVMARGGWGNRPHVIWEDRKDVTFAISEGVVTNAGLGILMGANVLSRKEGIIIPKTELLTTDSKGRVKLRFVPVMGYKIFAYQYSRNNIQEKIINYRLDENYLDFGDKFKYTDVYIDYYYSHNENSLVYTLEKERFNGWFSLEGRFYTKDETDGLNHSNILYMPKVRVVSGINLRLGERADPTMSIFNVVAMPARIEGSDSAVARIIALDDDIDADY